MTPGNRVMAEFFAMKTGDDLYELLAEPEIADRLQRAGYSLISVFERPWDETSEEAA